jgi:hypothetical protein
MSAVVILSPGVGGALLMAPYGMRRARSHFVNRKVSAGDGPVHRAVLTVVGLLQCPE